MSVERSALNVGRSGAAWPWPDAMDALVAASKHHRLVLENVGDRELRLISVELKDGV